MAKQQILAATFALMVSSLQADNCKTVSNGAYQVKAGSTSTMYCPDNSVGCGNFKDGRWVDCGCSSACCTPVSNTCAAAASSGSSCGDDHFRDTTKLATAVLADKSDYKTNCCKAKNTCDLTCQAGMSKKSTYATIKCAGETCSQSECCEADPKKCLGLMATLCDTGKTFDTAKAGSAATTDTFKAECCRTKITCEKDAFGGVFKCQKGSKDKATKANATCMGEKFCKPDECCDLISDPMCSTFTPNATDGCDPATEYIHDHGKTQVVKADSSDFKKVCCAKKATCKAFADTKLPPGRKYGKIGETSGAVKQQALAIAVLAGVGGYLFFDRCH